MDINETRELASNKAFAKITMLKIEIKDLKDDIKYDNTGGLTIEELELMYEVNKKELKVWEYMCKLIETDNKEICI